jgi:hypothetical protein
VAWDGVATRRSFDARCWTWSRPVGRSPRSPRRSGSATSRSLPGGGKTASTRGLVHGLTSAEKGELAAAKRRITKARDQAAGDAPRDGAGPSGGAPKRRFQAVTLMAAEHIPVEVACRVLDVSVSGY